MDVAANQTKREQVQLQIQQAADRLELLSRAIDAVGTDTRVWGELRLMVLEATRDGLKKFVAGSKADLCLAQPANGPVLVPGKN